MSFDNLTPEAIATRINEMSHSELVTALIDAMETLREADRKLAMLDAELLARVNELCDLKGRHSDADRRARKYHAALTAINMKAHEGLLP
jgi:hypothetical protein